MRIPHRRLAAGVAALATATALAGCASGDADAGDADAASDSEFGECAEAPVDGVDLDAALALVDTYQQPADGLAVTEPLAEPIDPETTLAFVDIGTVVSAMMWDYVDEAATTAGIDVTHVEAGTDAQSINAAFDSVVQSPPDILLAPTIDPTFWTDQLAALQDAGTTIVSAAITNAEDFGLQDGYGGHGASIENGAVLAAAAITMTCGQSTDFVFYNIPEFAFSQVQLESAQATLDELCDGQCDLRVVDIPVAQMATGGPDAVVSDLQAHPETAAFITPADELQVGLPAKQELAGLDVPGLGQSSTPPNIQQITDGTQAGGFAVDLRMFMWLIVDQGLRIDQGMEYPEPDWASVNPQLSTILTQDNAEIALDGYIAVDDYQQQFAALWGVE